MTRRAAVTLAVCLISSLCLRAAEPKQPKHLAEAKDLVEHLDLKNTNYEHGPGQIKCTGTRHSPTDCSGLLVSCSSTPTATTRTRSSAWFDSPAQPRPAITMPSSTRRASLRITSVPEIRPGDILAVKYRNRKDNTSHIMLVAEKPTRRKPSKPIVDGAEEQWEINIIDSSKTGHGLTDTRHKKGADGKDHDGLGKGVTRIYADRSGKVIGFSWSVLGASEFKDPRTSTWSWAAGRNTNPER